MIRSTIDYRPRAIACVALALAFMATSSAPAQFVLVDSEGFENLALADLEGQFVPTFGGAGTGQFLASPVTSASEAFIQTATVASGSQALQVNRVANSDDFFGVPVAGSPLEQFVLIDFDLAVEATGADPGVFGPFFGVSAFDDAGSTGLLGSLGVDATTGDVLIQAEGTGFFTETGSVVDFGEFNSFRLALDFDNDLSFAFLNGQLIATTGFVDPGLDDFSDASISALAAGGDPVSQALTGTAFFDNFIVVESAVIPEPSSAVILLLGAAASLGGRKRV